MDEYAIYYEDTPSSWRAIKATDPLSAAKDFVLQSPRRGDCSVVVNKRYTESKECKVYERWAGVFSERTQADDSSGRRKGGSTSAPLSGLVSGVGSAETSLRVARLPVWRTALFLTALYVTVLVLLSAFLGAIAAIAWGLAASMKSMWLLAIAGFVGALQFAVPLTSVFLFLPISFPILLVINALLVLAFNAACRITGGLRVQLK